MRVSRSRAASLTVGKISADSTVLRRSASAPLEVLRIERRPAIDQFIFERSAIVLRKPWIGSVAVRKDLEVIGVTDSLAGIDINPDRCHLTILRAGGQIRQRGDFLWQNRSASPRSGFKDDHSSTAIWWQKAKISADDPASAWWPGDAAQREMSAFSRPDGLIRASACAHRRHTV
jgi:hypothetical protein